MKEEPQPMQENSQAAAGKRIPYLRVIGVVAVLLLAGLIVYLLFQNWSLLVSQSDDQPAPAKESQQETAVGVNRPSAEERVAELEARMETAEDGDRDAEATKAELQDRIEQADTERPSSEERAAELDARIDGA